VATSEVDFLFAAMMPNGKLCPSSVSRDRDMTKRYINAFSDRVDYRIVKIGKLPTPPPRKRVPPKNSRAGGRRK